MFYTKRKLQALVMSTVLVVGSIVPVAADTTSTSKATFNSVLKVLEIQPGNSYILSNTDQTKNIFKEAFGVQEVVIEQMPITLFNADRSELNGQYDVIYLGVGTESTFSRSGNGATYSYKEDYGQIDASKGSISNNFIYGGKDEAQVETFTPIDITQLKASQILKQAKLGQMIIIDSDLEDVDDTNMEELVDAIEDEDNVVIVEELRQNQLASQLKKAGEKYQTNKVTKRPYLEVKQDDTEAGSRHLGFSVQAYNHNDLAGNMDINVYVDANGNGHFEAEELVEKSVKKDLTNAAAESKVGLNLTIPNDYAGYLGYKIEVHDKTTGMCNYETYVREYTTSEPQVIRVLQLLPNKGATFNILSNKEFVKLYEASASTPDALDNYKFEVEVKTVKEFVAQYPADKKNTQPVYEIIEQQRKNGTLEAFLNKAGEDTKLNGHYDMVMMGFRDNYEHISNNAAIIDLMYFMQTGQSVMFTHDAMGLAKSNEKVVMPDYVLYDTLSQKEKNQVNNSQTKWLEDYGKEMTLAMREFVGQGTYKPEAKTDRYGYVNYLVNGLNVGMNTTRSVKKINEGQITDYPYAIGDITPVANTHHQWYELDLEDPEIDVWYTLTNGVYNWYDPIQSYYTYSKGNITYSGTGHSGGYPVEEQKMFVNTMVKAASAANHAPGIQVSDIVAGQMIDYRVDRPFKMKVTDIDILDDMANYEVYVYGEGQVPDKDALSSTIPEGAQLVTKGTTMIDQEVDVTLAATTLDKVLEKNGTKVVENQDFFIVIKAIDEKGAEKTVTIDLRAGKPALEVSYVWDKPGYLVGDTATVTATVDIANSDDTKNEKVVLSYVDENGATVLDTLTELNTETFSKTYTIDITGKSKNELNAAISYTFDTENKVDAYTKGIPTAEGTIEVKVVDELETPITGVEVKLTAPDGTETTKTVLESGSVNLVGCVSGTYNIAITGEDTALFGEKLKTTTLCYDALDPSQYQKTVEFKATDSQPPTILADYSPKTKTLAAVDILAKLDGTGSNIQIVTWLEGKHEIDEMRDNTSATPLVIANDAPTDPVWSGEIVNKAPDATFVGWAKFIVKTNGWYTIYAKDQGGKEAVIHIEIDNIQDLITDIT